MKTKTSSEVWAGSDETIIPMRNSQNVYEETWYYAIFEADPDVSIYYKAGKGGYVTKSYEQYSPASSKPSGSEAVANKGYDFVN